MAPKKNTKQGRKTKTPAAKKGTTDDADDDDMAFLDSVIQANKGCGVSGCKESNAFSFVTCSLCRKRFCLNHRHSFLRGCDEKYAEKTKRGSRPTKEDFVANAKLSNKISNLRAARSKTKKKKKKN